MMELFSLLRYDDTAHKERLFGLLTEHYTRHLKRVSLNCLMLMEESWNAELKEMLN